jgi:peroxiredoxin
LNAFTQEGKHFMIEGKLGKFSAPATVFLFYKDQGSNVAIKDSCVMEQGQFSFEGQIEYPSYAQLVFAANGQLGSVTAADDLKFYLDYGKINITGFQLYNAQISGSPSNDLFMEYQKLTVPVQKEAEEIKYTFETASPEKLASKAFKDSLDKRFFTLINDYNQLSMSFIMNHPNSILSIYMLQSELFTHPNNANIEPIFLMMSDSIKNTKPGKRLAANIESNKRLQNGTTAPDFQVNDINGNPVSLSDFRGKYILFVFWSPKCDHCLAEIENLQKAYSLFKDNKFIIISFAIETEENKKEWIDTVKKYNMTWPAISDLKLWDSDIVKSYKAYSVPTNYLISPEGIILDRDLLGNNLLSKLNEIIDVQ